jgi:hypothetical protein
LPSYGHPLSSVLDKITQASRVDVEDVYEDAAARQRFGGRRGVWFWLLSPDDSVVYTRLQSAWPSIVGPNGASFALIHCRSGVDAGLLLHYLATPAEQKDHPPGCHEIQAW